MPELTKDLLATFHQVTPEEHKRFAAGVVRPRGRPKKPDSEKEKPVAIRFSSAFLEKLKRRAAKQGYQQWQSYAKKVLADDVDETVH